MQAVELTLCPIDVLLVLFSYKQDILLAVVVTSLTTTNTPKLGRFKKKKRI